MNSRKREGRKEGGTQSTSIPPIIIADILPGLCCQGEGREPKMTVVEEPKVAEKTESMSAHMDKISYAEEAVYFEAWKAYYHQCQGRKRNFME